MKGECPDKVISTVAISESILYYFIFLKGLCSISQVYSIYLCRRSSLIQCKDFIQLGRTSRVIYRNIATLPIFLYIFHGVSSSREVRFFKGARNVPTVHQSVGLKKFPCCNIICEILRN